MKILTASQTRQSDAATMQREPIASIDLMERASYQFTQRFVQQFPEHNCPVYIFCGLGNNGGDGLAIARMLLAQQYNVLVFIIGSKKGSNDFETNLKRLVDHSSIQRVSNKSELPTLPTPCIVIDAMFGSGLNRALEGLYTQAVQLINESSCTIVAVDIPSGLYADKSVGDDDPVVQADFTYTFQLPKLAFLLPQNEKYVGNWAVVNIKLDAKFLQEVEAQHHYLTPEWMKKLRQRRKNHSHKGTYGKALLISGSYGKMGAAVLCSRACARGGVGLLTTHVPGCGYEIMQISVPEAMTTVDQHHEYFSELPQEGTTNLANYDVIGIGPGLGTAEATVQALKLVLETTNARSMRMVLDADALNICGQHQKLLESIPKNSILTPHPKEFERLTEKAQNDFHRLDLLKEFCQRYRVYTVLKGSHTAIGTPEGDIYFNSSGNPGMATGGSGDVLTGILTALIAQQYDSLSASLLGVYLHGLAGDLAAKKFSQEALVASDIVESLGAAFTTLY
ncbi:MAG: NAD(P)H-hydrate dehydratase [Tunicatimonas sp.]|uniref:NAD(P)H-hydrate dehydratase n=1 Tax=Tunicatimonas sp. TaxID=1940096 RepID=UPI003C7664CE